MNIQVVNRKLQLASLAWRCRYQPVKITDCKALQAEIASYPFYELHLDDGPPVPFTDGVWLQGMSLAFSRIVSKCFLHDSAYVDLRLLATYLGHQWERLTPQPNAHKKTIPFYAKELMADLFEAICRLKDSPEYDTDLVSMVVELLSGLTTWEESVSLASEFLDQLRLWQEGEPCQRAVWDLLASDYSWNKTQLERELSGRKCTKSRRDFILKCNMFFDIKIDPLFLNPPESR